MHARHHYCASTAFLCSYKHLCCCCFRVLIRSKHMNTFHRHKILFHSCMVCVFRGTRHGLSLKCDLEVSTPSSNCLARGRLCVCDQTVPLSMHYEVAYLGHTHTGTLLLWEVLSCVYVMDCLRFLRSHRQYCTCCIG